MGAWGTAIFSDDTAADVKGEYRDLIGDGLDGPRATDKLVSEWADSTEDPDDGPVFWLALAATQWACGRLEDRVRERALMIIEDGSDLRRWDDPRLRSKRARVLDQLANQLRSPQPAPKHIPRTYRQATSLRVGDVLRYTMVRGGSVLLRVVGLHTDKGGTGPVLELLEWSENQPLPVNLESHPARMLRELRAGPVRPVGFLVFVRPRKYPFPEDRVEVIAHVNVASTPVSPTGTWWGERLDRLIEEALNPPDWRAP